MDFPQSFDNPVFPSFKRLALARWMSIWTLFAFFIAICICGFLFWAVRSTHSKPFLISIDENSGEWVSISEKTKIKQIPSFQVMQESVVLNFARRWFSISDVATENEARWCKCSPDICDRYVASSEGKMPCSLCCGSSENLYATFVKDVLPNYQLRVEQGEVWTIDTNSIILHPDSKLVESGGVWHMRALVRSNLRGNFDVEAYAIVAKSSSGYPLNFGYYVSDFSAFNATTGGSN